MIDDDLKIFRISLPTPFPVGPVNVFLIKAEEPILVDAGVNTDEAWDKLVGALREHGLAPADLKTILLTHGHLDHIGLMPRLINETQAKSYAHPDVVGHYRAFHQELEEGQQFYSRLMLEFGTPSDVMDQMMQMRSLFNSLGATFEIDHALADREVVAGFEVHYVPGHSAADTLFYDRARRIAIVGDHLLKGISPNPLLRRASPEGDERSRSLVEYQHSLRHTHSLEMDTCYPGHGGPFREHRAIIDGLLERHERRTKEILALLREGDKTPYQIVKCLFPKITAASMHFAMSVAIGHLDVLEELGEAQVEIRDSVTWYKTT